MTFDAEYMRQFSHAYHLPSEPGEWWEANVVTIVNPNIKAYEKEIKALRRQVRALRFSLRHLYDAARLVLADMDEDAYSPLRAPMPRAQRILMLTIPKEVLHGQEEGE